MKKLLSAAILAILLMQGRSYAGEEQFLRVKNAGGTVDINNVTEITVPDGTLTDDGDGRATVDMTSGGGTPGTPDTSVQFNSGGAFGGDSAMTFNKTTDVFSVTSVSGTTGTLSHSMTIGPASGATTSNFDDLRMNLNTSTLGNNVGFTMEGNRNSSGAALAGFSFKNLQSTTTSKTTALIMGLTASTYDAESGALSFQVSNNSGTQLEYLNLNNRNNTPLVAFNENSNDIDVKMEGDTVDNLFYLDAGQENIGIGAAPASGNRLQVTGVIESKGSATGVYARGTAGIGSADRWASYGTSGNEYVGVWTTAPSLRAWQGIGSYDASGNIQHNFTNAGASVFNEQGNDSDFRVEGDTNANLIFADASADMVGIGTSTPGYTLDVVGGIRATRTLTAGVGGYGTQYVITSAGSGADSQYGSILQLNAGYTGSNTTVGLQFENNAAGTQSNYVSDTSNISYRPGGNYGLVGFSKGTTTGIRTGIFTAAASGNTNYGLWSSATVTKNSAVNVGVAGFGLNGGTSSTQVGGYFSLYDAGSAPSFASAALMADNGSQTSDIFVARDNGTAVFTIADGGAVTVNEPGNDADFRIESDTQANMFVLDAGLNQLQIGNATTVVGQGGTLAIGGNAPTPGATNTLAIKVGTIPTTSPADIIQLYAQDVAAGTAEAGHWKWNDNAANTTVADSSGNSNTGTLTGGDNTSTLSTTGKINQAFNLDGSADYVAVTDSASVSPSNITIALWINPDTIADANCMVHKTNAYNLSYGFTAIGGTSGKITFAVFSGGAWRVVSATVGISTSTWTHIVGTFDGSTLKIYVNGTQDANTTSYSGSISDSGDTLLLGYGNAAGRYIDGKLDDIRIYGTAITSGEVATLYNSGSGTESSLASSYAELKVRDELGNVTTLSPHNTSMIPASDMEGQSTTWTHYQENEYTGTRFTVNMEKMARLVQELSGEQIIYEESVDPVDTSKNLPKAMRDIRKKNRDAIKARRDAARASNN